ncbi:10602_t:CDS:2 [Entrophospora sp. SA101]|nr:10602_t:CDS:2 [Entrophospora sp. SA101]
MFRFADLKPTIEATLQKIQHEYLEGNPRLGYNLNGSLTKISSTSYPYIGNHKLTFNNGYEDDLMVDISPLKLNLSRIAHSGDVQLSDEQNQILNLAKLPTLDS